MGCRRIRRTDLLSVGKGAWREHGTPSPARLRRWNDAGCDRVLRTTPSRTTAPSRHLSGKLERAQPGGTRRADNRHRGCTSHTASQKLQCDPFACGGCLPHTTGGTRAAALRRSHPRRNLWQPIAPGLRQRHRPALSNQPTRHSRTTFTALAPTGAVYPTDRKSVRRRRHALHRIWSAQHPDQSGEEHSGRPPA